MNDKVKVNVKKLINALEHTTIDPFDIDYLTELDDRFKKAMINILEFEKGLGCYGLRIIRDFMVDTIKTFCNTDGDWDEELPLLDRLNLYKEWQSLFNELSNNGELKSLHNLYFRWNTVQNLLTMDGVLFSISDIISSFVDLTKEED